MGCDIHIRAEIKSESGWEPISDFAPFDWRQYGMYGFLANVRNYSAVPPISTPRGLPDGLPAGDYEGDSYLGYHSHSWLSVAELLAFNYDQQIEDRRVTREISPGFNNGSLTAAPGGGEITTYREFLGPAFFIDLERLRQLGADRIVFGFDS